MTRCNDPVDGLIEKAGCGDHDARQALLAYYRDRLRSVVAMRIDPRVAARVDASDVVQETLIDADRKLDAYMRIRPLPFYPWLRNLALERVVFVHRQHLGAQCRTVALERRAIPELNDESHVGLVDCLAGDSTTPSADLIRQELRERVKVAMCKLSPIDREILAARYLEQLSFAEIAAILEISENTAKVRHLRALERIRPLLADGSNGTSR